MRRQVVEIGDVVHFDGVSAEVAVDLGVQSSARNNHADDRAELETVYAELDRLTPRQVESQSYRPEHELFHWPLGFAILVSLLYFGSVELTSMLRRSRRGRQPVAQA